MTLRKNYLGSRGEKEADADRTLPCPTAVYPTGLPAVPSGQASDLSPSLPPDDRLAWWADNYLAHAVTTASSSRQVQRRDLAAFVRFAEREGVTARPGWSPRLSRAFLDHLRTTRKDDGGRAWSDRTIHRIMAHLKRFARWVHAVVPLPLGDPVRDIRLPAAGSGLDIERAITDAERRRLLDAADTLPKNQGRSRDRRRHPGVEPAERPVRPGARPWRNRAMIYGLIETGMRRAALVALEASGIDWARSTLKVVEKGGAAHAYAISRQGLAALQDYAERERPADAAAFPAARAFFLPAAGRRSDGRLAPIQVNRVWDDVCQAAAVEGRSPHSARHAMGRRLIKRTGNIAAVQRQLGHRNAVYSIQYSRVTDQELHDALEES